MKVLNQNGNINISTGQKQNYSKDKNTNAKLNLFLKQENNFDDAIKSLKEQIEAVNGNEKYSDETKKVKVEQLQKRIAEIEKMKAEQLQEALKHNNEEKQKIKKKDKYYTDINEHGDTYLSEEDAKLLIQAEISKEKLSMYAQNKAKVSADAHRIEDELKKDKERGLDMFTFKEGLLKKLKDAIIGFITASNKEVGDINGMITEELKREEDEIKQVDPIVKQEDTNTKENKPLELVKDETTIKTKEEEPEKKHERVSFLI